MTENDRGKMGEMPKLVRGERGVSILGALVVALMLGAGAVATFELATPSLSSIASESQTASSHEAKAAAAKEAAARKAAEAKAAKEKKEKEDREKAIQKKCEEAEKSLAKARVGEKTKHPSKTFENNVDPVEPSRCVGAIKISETATKCVGLKSEIALLSGGRVRVTSQPDASIENPGTCQSEYCSQELKEDKKTAGKKCAPAAVDGYKPIKKQAREQGLLDKVGSNAKDNLLTGPISKAEGKVLADNLRPEQEKAQDDYESAKAETKGAKQAYDEIKCLAGDIACKDLKETAGKEYIAARERELEAKKKFDELSNKIKRLEGGGGPPVKVETTEEKIAREAREKAEAEARKREQHTGFNDKGGGGGGGDGGPKFTPPSSAGPQSFPGRPPAAGNGVPQPPGTCSPSVICGNNTLYSRNNQCVDQVMQQCQYGCSGTQCAQAPQQGQGCQQAPSQPDPSGCQNGSWRPTYTGACVSSWQCVPTGGPGSSGQLSAAISCQPQVADVGMTIAITYSCSSGSSEGSGFQTGGALTGSTTVTIANPPAGTNVATYGLKCTDQGTSASKQCSVQIAKPAIVLVANPKVVQSGKTSAIGWVTSGMQSCVISSPDNQSFTDEHKNTTNVNGSVVTPALTRSSDFILKCVTLGGSTKEASTRVTVQ